MLLKSAAYGLSEGKIVLFDDLQHVQSNNLRKEGRIVLIMLLYYQSNFMVINFIIIIQVAMGCTDSTVVAQNKLKPVFAMALQTQCTNILMGEIQQNKYMCLSAIVPKSAQQNLQIVKKQLPKVVQNEIMTDFQPPNFAQITCINESNLYVITGGINYKLDNIYNNAYLFDSRKNTVHKLPNFKQPRYTHSAIYCGEYLYIIGGRYFGQDQQALLSSCQKMHLPINQQPSAQTINMIVTNSKLAWETVASMNVKRCSQVSVSYHNRIYVFGGYTGQFQRSTIIEYLNHTTKNCKWEILNVQLPFGIQSCASLANNHNEITIFGGNSNSGPTDTVLTLNLFEGFQSVHSNRKMKSKKTLHKIFKGQDQIFVIGGNQDMDLEMYQIDGQDHDQKITIKSNKQPDKKGNKTINTSILSKHLNSIQQFQLLSHTQPNLTIPFKQQAPNQKSHPDKSANDQIVYIFGTSSQPFVLQLNISVPYAAYHSVPLSIKVNALQGAVCIGETQQYLLFGGISDSQEDISDHVYLFNPDYTTKNNRQIAKMNIPKYAFGFQKIGQFVYAIGGGTADQQGQLLILNKCQKFNIKDIPNPNSKSIANWSKIADLPYGLISPMTLNYKNTLYIFGGMLQTKQRNKKILKYNDKADAWIQLKFAFPFGLQASSIYQKKDNQFVIFGGRVVNGDSKSIWDLTFIENGEDCVFVEVGQMNQAKCLHHAYKPRKQNFIVILGGQKQLISCYDCQSLKSIQSDVLIGMKKIFQSSLASLRDKTLKNYTIAIRQ